MHVLAVKKMRKKRNAAVILTIANALTIAPAVIAALIQIAAK